jgi:hypothetical protein
MRSISRARRALILGAAALAVPTLLLAQAGPALAAKPAPDTIIDSGPASITNATSATFSFHSTGNSATFTCKLDTAAFTACVSPRPYSGLTAGSHTFQVVSTSGGVTDPSPATYTWTIDLTPPGAPVLTASPTSPTSVSVSWTASTDNVALAGYDVLRGGTLLASVGTSTLSYTDSTVDGGQTYSYAVRARDTAGNSTTSAPVSVTTPLPPSYDPGLTRAPYLTDLVGTNVIVNFATARNATTASVQWGPVVNGACAPSTPVAATRITVAVGAVY